MYPLFVSGLSFGSTSVLSAPVEHERSSVSIGMCFMRIPLFDLSNYFFYSSYSTLVIDLALFM